MNRPPFDRKSRAFLVFALFIGSAVLGAFTSAVAAAPAPQAITPSYMAGSTDYTTAPFIESDGFGGYGVRNASTGNVEPIRGWLSKATGPLTHFYKISLSRGKVLNVHLDTEGATILPSGQITPDFQIFVYTGIPSVLTMIDWNIQRFSDIRTQELSILTPVGGGVPNVYYVNVTIWYGVGWYDLRVNVTDPIDLGPVGGDFPGVLDPEGYDSFPYQGAPDTRWYRFFASHDENTQTFNEVSGWLDITNWNALVPYQVDALIRIFTEDLGYSPDNPVGKPIEKSEAPNRKTEPFSVLAPYTGTYYVMLRTTNLTEVRYNLHINISNIPRFPAGGVINVHKERDFDDTDWYWFNMTKGSGTGKNDRAIFNLSETSDDVLRPVNMNLWLFGKRNYFSPSGASLDFDILNSSFLGDAPYNISLNPEPRHEEVAAQAMYTGIYFLEVETYNNTGNYSITLRFDNPANVASSDYNNEPSQAQAIDWGRLDRVPFDQSEDHTDFYKITAKAGETIEAFYQMPNRKSPDGLIGPQPMGLVWIGIYQPGMILLNWSWNYWYDFLNTADHLENTTYTRATVATDGDYIIEVTAMQDGYIGPWQISPMRTLQVFWHMDWNFATEYTLYVSRLPNYNAFPETPYIKAPLQELVIDEDTPAVGVLNLTDYFGDPDLIQGDSLKFNFSFSGPRNLTITHSNGLVTVTPNQDFYGRNVVLVVATDQTNQKAQQFWNITVNSVNDPPEQTSTTPVRFGEDSGIRIVNLVDYVRDADGDILTFTPLPDDNVTLTFTATTIRIATVPDFQTTTGGADYPVQFDVSDGIATTRMTLFLNVTNSLDAPRVLQSPVVVNCVEDAPCPTVDLNTVFLDPDDGTLNFLVSSNGEINFSVFNGILTLLPPQDWSGGKTIQLQAIKFSGTTPYPSDKVDLNLIVREVNDPPRPVSYSPSSPNISVAEGTSRSFTFEAADPEHVQPTYKWYQDGEQLDTTLSSYTFIAGHDLATWRSSRVVTLRAVADDGSGGTVSFEWTITIIDVPRLPQVAISSPLEGREYFNDQPVTFFASAYDPDGDQLTFAWKVVGSGTTILESANGTYLFTQVGFYQITLTVHDGVGYANATVNITIKERPAKPFLPGFDATALLGALAAAATVAAVVRRRRSAE